MREQLSASMVTQSMRDEIESESMRVKHCMYLIICIKSIIDVFAVQSNNITCSRFHV